MRLSFALSAWKRLAAVHPPALQAMLEARATAAQLIDREENPHEAFDDFEALNRVLGDRVRSLARFLELHENRPAVAKAVYTRVEDLLVDSKRFDICNRYIDPEKQFHKAREVFESVSLGAKRRAPDGMPTETWQQIQARQRKQIELRFADHALRIIKILRANDRNDEAKAIATKAQTELKHGDHAALIDAALKDQVDE